MSRHILRFATLCALVLGLSACSSDKSATNGLQLLRSAPALLLGKKAPPPRLTQDQIAQALAATDQPLILVELEATRSQSLLIQIERNRGHATFATPTRQAVVLKDGMVTATRGLGGDLMSSDETALLRAVRAGSGGKVPYVLRFVTPEDVTKSYNLTCTVTRTPSAAKADCAGDGVAFTNTYSIGARGQIASSRQWIGQTLGYIKVTTLRG